MPEPSHPLVPLPGSERAPLADAEPAGQLDTSERAEVTLILRRRAGIPAEIVAGPTVLTSDELAGRYGADPADVDLVRRTAGDEGLEVTAVDPASRRLKVAGTLGQLSGTFGVTLRQVSSPAPKGHGTVTHRYREGPVYVPAPLAGVVTAVLGLDTRPQARPHFRVRRAGASAAAAAAAPGGTYAPNQVAGIYRFPDGTSGAGQTIAVIELGGGWTAQGRSAMDAAMADAAALGITVCVASGDNGSDDGVGDGRPHTDFPASSPHALACGGTKLIADPSTGVISSEVVWNETAAHEGAGGGGVSDTFAVPSWQANAGVPAQAGGAGGSGRGVPDVAGNADPVTGYQVYSGGHAQVVGGTSAVAPLWAALVSRLAEATGKRFGLIQALLYAGVTPGTAMPGFNDITSGSNGAYTAGPGWDACSGLGSPDGNALVNRLNA